MLITVDQYKKIARETPADVAAEAVKWFNELCPEFGIMSGDSLHECLANILHESDELTVMEENLNYSVKRLMDVWPNRFKTAEAAQPFANNPKKLAEKVYSGRMGNEQLGDAWDFRGSGPIQLTGRSMFIAFSQFMRNRFGMIKTAQQWAEILRSKELNNLKWQIYSALWLFAMAKDLVQAAIDDEMLKIVKRINGGVNGLADRLRYYELCKKYIPE